MASLTHWMRTQQKKFLAIICAVIMFTWVIGGAIGRLVTPSRVPGGELFGRSVSGEDVALYMKCVAIIAGRWLPRDPKAVNATAWQTLLLARAAREVGLDVANEQVDAKLKELFPAANGTVDMQAYRTTLSHGNTSPVDFERVVRDYVAGQELMKMAFLSPLMSEEEAWRWWSRQNAEATVRYAFLNARKLKPYATVTEAQIESQYEAYRDKFPDETPNSVGYKRPQRIRVEYILIETEPLMKKVKVSKKEIEEYYNKHKDKYRVLEKKDEKKDADKKDKKGAAGKKPEKPEAPVYKKLAEVAKEIEESLKREKAREMAGALNKKAMEEIGRQRDIPLGSTADPIAVLEEIAKKLGVTYKTTDWFTKKGVAKALPGVSKLNEDAFDGTKRAVNEPHDGIEGDKGLIIYQVKDTVLSGPPPLKDVREKVEEDARLVQAALLAERIVKKAILKKTFDAAVADIRAQVKALEVKAGKEKADAADKTGKKTAKADAKKPEAEKKGEEKSEEILQVGGTRPFRRPRFGQGMAYGFIVDDKGGFHNWPLVAGEAFTLRAGRMGAVPATGQFGGEVGAFAVSLTDMEYPTKAQYLKEGKEQYPRLLQDKRQQVFQVWRADLIRRAAPTAGAAQALRALGWPAGAPGE